MNIKIRLIKSCKKINSSIIGELASCKPNWLQFIILIYIYIYKLTSFYLALAINNIYFENSSIN